MDNNSARRYSRLELLRAVITTAWIAIGVTLLATALPTGQIFVETQVFLQKYVIGYSCSTCAVVGILLSIRRKIKTTNVDNHTSGKDSK